LTQATSQAAYQILPPRHGMPFDSRSVGSEHVSMWCREISACLCVEEQQSQSQTVASPEVAGTSGAYSLPPLESQSPTLKAYVLPPLPRPPAPTSTLASIGVDPQAPYPYPIYNGGGAATMAPVYPAPPALYVAMGAVACVFGSALSAFLLAFIPTLQALRVGRCRLKPVFASTEQHVVGVYDLPVCDALRSYHLLLN